MKLILIVSFSIQWLTWFILYYHFNISTTRGNTTAAAAAAVSSLFSETTFRRKLKLSFDELILEGRSFLALNPSIQLLHYQYLSCHHHHHHHHHNHHHNHHSINFLAPPSLLPLFDSVSVNAGCRHRRRGDRREHEQ